MRFDDGIFGLYSRLYENRREVELSVDEYPSECFDNPAHSESFPREIDQFRS